MQTLLLGSHNLETRSTRHTCYLIDGVLAVDAGSLVTGLSTPELEGIQALLLTHHHFDHTRDVPTLGLVRRDAAAALAVYGLAETLEGTRRHLMDGEVYPDFTEPLNEDPPRFVARAFTPGVAFKAAGHEVKALPVPHPVPAVGYIVRDGQGACIAITGDTGGDLMPFFRDPWAPQTLFVEATFPDQQKDLARLTGHLTPGLLRDQLVAAKEQGLSLPKIIAVHRGLGSEADLLRQLAHVKADLGVQLVPGYQGMVV